MSKPKSTNEEDPTTAFGPSFWDDAVYSITKQSKVSKILPIQNIGSTYLLSQMRNISSLQEPALIIKDQSR
jgi:hypothetical protein